MKFIYSGLLFWNFPHRPLGVRGPHFYNQWDSSISIGNVLYTVCVCIYKAKPVCSSPSCRSAGTTREHLGLALALKVPVFVVVSKVDVCVGGAVQKTVRQLERLLKLPGCNKVPMLISNRDDAVTAAQRFAQSSRYTLRVSVCVCVTDIDIYEDIFIA